MAAILDSAEGDTATAELLCRHDRDRYLLALFAPAERRAAVCALYAFNAEIALIPERVSEPMLGQIRIQWWRDGIDAAFAGNSVRRHEVLTPLAAAIRTGNLGRDHFARLLDARERDLAAEPPPTLAALEAYAEETAAPLQLLVLEALDAGTAANQAAREAAIAYALAGLLRATPYLARQRRHILPQALIDETGCDPETLFAGNSAPAVTAIATRIAERARHHLDASRQRRGDVPRQALPALLPAVLAAADLRRLGRAGFDPFAPALARPDQWRSWRLTAAALRGRY